MSYWKNLAQALTTWQTMIQDALGTTERGDALVEVARNAHRAEVEANADIGFGLTVGDLLRAARQPDTISALATLCEALGDPIAADFLAPYCAFWSQLPVIERIGLLIDCVVGVEE